MPAISPAHTAAVQPPTQAESRMASPARAKPIFTMPIATRPAPHNSTAASTRQHSRSSMRTRARRSCASAAAWQKAGVHSTPTISDTVHRIISSCVPGEKIIIRHRSDSAQAAQAEAIHTARGGRKRSIISSAQPAYCIGSIATPQSRRSPRLSNSPAAGKSSPRRVYSHAHSAHTAKGEGRRKHSLRLRKKNKKASPNLPARAGPLSRR